MNPGAAHKHRSKSQSAKLSRAPQREEGKTVTVKKLPVKHEEEDVPASPVFVQVETLKPKDVFVSTNQILFWKNKKKKIITEKYS